MRLTTAFGLLVAVALALRWFSLHNNWGSAGSTGSAAAPAEPRSEPSPPSRARRVKKLRWSTCRPRSKEEYGKNHILSLVFEPDFKKWGFRETSAANWLLFFPCSVFHVDAEVAKLPPLKHPARHVVMSVPGTTPFCIKTGLWRRVLRRYGWDAATGLLPPTWVLKGDDGGEQHRALRAYSAARPQAAIILKKAAHRQVPSSRGASDAHPGHPLACTDVHRALGIGSAQRVPTRVLATGPGTDRIRAGMFRLAR